MTMSESEPSTPLLRDDDGKNSPSAHMHPNPLVVGRFFFLLFLLASASADAHPIQGLPLERRAIAQAFYGLSIPAMAVYVAYDVVLIFTCRLTLKWAFEHGYLLAALLWRVVAGVAYCVAWALAVVVITGPDANNPDIWMSVTMAGVMIATLPSGVWYYGQLVYAMMSWRIRVDEPTPNNNATPEEEKILPV